MPYYKLYVLDESDRVTGRCEMAFADDDAAVAGAARAFRGQAVEIWEGARCIMTAAGQGPRQQEGDLHRAVDILA